MEEILTSGDIPQRPNGNFPQDNAGNIVWDLLCKCWSDELEDRPTAANVCRIMQTVPQTLDGVTPGSPRLMDGEGSNMDLDDE
ncbi:unnamed protein product [Rhizoctonia solani]|uniref:Uncharacterized protein n=1 Tax=Rhizoctonia solani TaxID=456999 RepID=A0A8H3HUX3_9AGAM|nr:unnamed protein product [Rhizoctonia solani]